MLAILCKRRSIEVQFAITEKSSKFNVLSVWHVCQHCRSGVCGPVGHEMLEALFRTRRLLHNVVARSASGLRVNNCTYLGALFIHTVSRGAHLRASLLKTRQGPILHLHMHTHKHKFYEHTDLPAFFFFFFFSPLLVLPRW